LTPKNGLKKHWSHAHILLGYYRFTLTEAGHYTHTTKAMTIISIQAQYLQSKSFELHLQFIYLRVDDVMI